MKLLLSHIADLDGISPVILLKLLNVEFDYALFEVGEINDYLSAKLEDGSLDKYEDIYITDISVSKEIADKINNSKYKDKFKLFDHHTSAMFLNDYEFAKVEESIEEYKVCGTTMFFNYLIENYDNEMLTKNSVITYLELVRECDTWDFTELKDEAMDLNTLYSFIGNEDFIDNYTRFLSVNDEFYFTKQEMDIIRHLNKNKQDYIEKISNNVIIKQIRGYKVGIVFAENYRSEIGHFIADKYSDIDLVAIINMNRYISLRTVKKNVDVSKFASYYGGAGHKEASGMPINEKVKQLIIGEIFDEDK